MNSAIRLNIAISATESSFPLDWRLFYHHREMETPPPAPRFRPDGSFTIVQATDLHVRTGDAADLRTVALLGSVLDAERPDLVVFTGDVISGSESPDPAAAWRLAVSPAVERGLPWTFVFGNHDDEGALSRRDLMALARALPGCLASPGPAELPGCGHHVLDVAGRGGAPAARLYLVDSGSYGPPGVSEYAWIGSAQIGWLRDRFAEAAGRTGLLFLHIPPPDYDRAWRTAPCRGRKFESVCCPAVDEGFFRAVAESGAVSGIFAGHDHVNDFEAELDGVRLCYGRAGGYGTYGHDALPRGARVIRLHEGRRGFATWFRLEGGAVESDLPVHEPGTAVSA
jgi:3',5'-cyclic AMP phosphodiesterase CpdA